MKPVLLSTTLGVAILVAGWWLMQGSVAELPTLSRGELAALEATPTDRDRLLVHLSARLLDGDRWGDWRQLDEPSRHLWTTANVEQEIATEGGLVAIAERAAGDSDTMPGFADAAAGYTAMGCTELADLCTKAAAATLPADGVEPAWGHHVRSTFQAQMPAAMAARIAYLQAHLDQVAQ